MQTSYNVEPPIALPGMKFDLSGGRVRSAVVNADSMFGVGVSYGPAAGKVQAPGAVFSEFGGVLLAELDHAPSNLVGKADGIAVVAGDVVSVAEAGKVYVLVDQDVAENDPVYMRIAPNGAGKLIVGAFRKDVDDPGGGATAEIVKGARFEGASFTVKIGATDFKVAPMSFDRRAALV